MLGGILHILFARFQVKLIDCSRTQWENICSDVNRETRSMSIDILDIVIMSFYEFGHVHWIEYTYRSSCPKVYCKNYVLKNFAKFTGKRLCQGTPATLLKKALAQAFSCEFVKFFKMAISQNTSEYIYILLSVLVLESPEEPLSTRLAALRMQLEEKRRQFEEEKQRKQQQWSQVCVSFIIIFIIIINIFGFQKEK